MPYGDNCNKSECFSWESWFSQGRRRAVWRGYLFFICRWKLKNVGTVPVVSLTRDRAPGATVLLLSLPPLLFTFYLLPFWSSPKCCHSLCGRRQRGRKRVKPLILSAIFSCLTFRLNSSHTCVVCRALRCFAQLQLQLQQHQAQLSRGAHWAPPWFVCLYVGSAVSFFQSCSLMWFPSHSRVLKRKQHAALNPQILATVSPSVLFFCQCSTSVSSGTSGMNVLLDTFTPLGPSWITGKKEELSCNSWARLPPHGLVIMGANERLPFCSWFLLMNKSVKCILTLGPFGRVSMAAKSHDAKNKNICRNYARKLSCFNRM